MAVFIPRNSTTDHLGQVGHDGLATAGAAAAHVSFVGKPECSILSQLLGLMPDRSVLLGSRPVRMCTPGALIARSWWPRRRGKVYSWDITSWPARPGDPLRRLRHRGDPLDRGDPLALAAQSLQRQPLQRGLVQDSQILPKFPDRFESIYHAEGFTDEFVDWYNHQHRHSGIGLG